MQELRQKLESFSRFIDKQIRPLVDKEKQKEIDGQLKLLRECVSDGIVAMIKLTGFLTLMKSHDLDALTALMKLKFGVTELPQEVESKLRLYLMFAQTAATDLTGKTTQQPQPEVSPH